MKVTGSTAVKGTVLAGGSGIGVYAVTTIVGSNKEEDKDSESVDGLEAWDASSIPKLLFNKPDFGTNGDYKSVEGTIGYTFGRFMMDPDENSDKWKELENKLKADSEEPQSEDFKKVKDTNGSSKELKEVCREVYKKNKSVTENSSGTDLYLDLWKYCSYSGKNPEFINDQGYCANGDQNRWGCENSNELYLLYANDISVWRYIVKHVLEVDLKNNSKKEKIDEVFRSIKSGTKLKKICLEAYASAPTNEKSDYGDSVIEYCSLDRKGPVSKYPTKPVKK